MNSFVLNQIGNLDEEVHAKYKGVPLKNAVQVTLFDEEEKSFSMFLLDFESSVIKEICFNALIHLLIE